MFQPVFDLQTFKAILKHLAHIAPVPGITCGANSHILAYILKKNSKDLKSICGAAPEMTRAPSGDLAVTCATPLYSPLLKHIL